MIVLGNDNTAFFDVDDTILFWKTKKDDPKLVPVTSNGQTQFLRPHYRHIENMKSHKFRGHTVIVWSAGGVEWAKTVVTALGLENYVDLVVAKPKWYYDDLQSHEFLPASSRVYHEDTE